MDSSDRPGPQRPRSRPPTPSGPPLGGDRALPPRTRFRWWHQHRGGVLVAVLTVLVVGIVAGAFVATRHVGDVADSGAAVDFSAAPSDTPTPTPSRTTTSPAPPPTSTAKGTVKAVTNGRWSLAVEKGLDLTVVLTSTTQFKHGSATTVKVGSNVTVTGPYASGTLTAQTVVFSRPASADGSGGS